MGVCAPRVEIEWKLTDYNGILQTNALAWLLSSNKAPHDAALH